MKRLLESVLEFRRNDQATFRERYAHLAQGQSPSAMLLACADSRLVSHLVAGYEPGELFVVRNAGNLAPRYEEAVADSSVAAAVAFGVEYLGIAHIVVCGHSSCGAMQALLNGRDQLDDPSLKAWLRHGDEALERLRNAEREVTADTLARENILLQMEHLRAHPPVQKHGVRVHGLYFELHSAEIYVYDPAAATFVVLDESQVQRLTES